MADTNIKKQFVVLLIQAGIIIASLIMLLYIEDPTKEYVSAFFLNVEKNLPKSKETQAIPTPLSELSISILTNVFRLLKIILWFILVIAIIRFINALIFNRALRNTNSYELTNLIRNVVMILLYIIAFFVIFQSQYPNVELAPLFTGSTIVGIVVGFALQDTLGNLFSGLALQADQPFQIGDVITLGEKGKGVIESITWRGVKIRTFQNKLLIIGNSIIGMELIEVAPKRNLNARLVFFNTLYSDPPAKTIRIVREAVRQCDNVSPKIRPIVRVRNLGDNGLDYEVKYWLTDYSKFNDTDALVRQRIWYAFQREGINFAYPTRTLYIEKDAPTEVPVENVNAVYERITGIPIFAPLSEAEAHELADAAETRIFAPGEPIVQQGERGGLMFIIHRGSVDVYLQEKEEDILIATLREGDFFGEMGLFTGETRVASVIAHEETKVLQISKKTLKPIFENNPNLVQKLNEFIEERRSEITQEDDTKETTVQKENKTVIKSIRKWFGLE